MAFMDFLFGEKEKQQKLPLYSPGQETVMGQLRQGGEGQLPDMFQFLQQILSQDPKMMEQFQAPAMRQFNEQIIPGIAEKFSGMGAQSSSGFTQALGGAGADLAERLGAQRAGMGSQAVAQLMSMLGGGLTQQHENVLRPKTPGFAQDTASTLMEILPKLLPLLLL